MRVVIMALPNGKAQPTDMLETFRLALDCGEVFVNGEHYLITGPDRMTNYSLDDRYFDQLPSWWEPR